MITVGIYGIDDTSRGRHPTVTHDHGVALMRDGHVITVVQLERWTGRKHDNRLPIFIEEILGRLLPIDEPVRFVSVNSFLGNRFISANGNLRIEPQRDVGVSAELVPAEVTWSPHGRRRRSAEGWVLCHEAAHLGSLLPFVGQFEDGALAAHVDGGASQSACSFWSINRGRPVLEHASWELLKDVVNNFNVSPVVRTILGLTADDHLALPGRLMGYAALGTPCDDLETWLRKERWLLDVDDAEASRLVRARLGEIDLRAKGYQDLCATLQRAFTDEVTAALLSRAPQRDTLYLAGGAALNIPTNARLQEHFGRVWVPPPTDDGGLALGAAAWVEHLDHGRLGVHTPFLNRFDTQNGEPDPAVVPEVAGRLLKGEVIGICNGAGEVGPRALGHRSMLARADRIDVRVRVSETIKRREWYRPVAPVLCEAAARYVLGDIAVASPLSRWMLGAWRINDGYREALRGVLHADGTVRAQVVPDDGENAWMHALLTHLWEEYGVPALINTSFNGPGQPIVQRHDDALELSRNLGLDAVVVHGALHRP